MSNDCERKEKESIERLKTITNNELRAKIKVNFGKIVDVRTKEEFQENHIDGAISIPIEELEDRLDQLDKKEEINVICDTGNKTKKAGEILEKHGFKMVSMVFPGMNEW